MVGATYTMKTKITAWIGGLMVVLTGAGLAVDKVAEIFDTVMVRVTAMDAQNMGPFLPDPLEARVDSLEAIHERSSQ